MCEFLMAFYHRQSKLSLVVYPNKTCLINVQPIHLSAILVVKLTTLGYSHHQQQTEHLVLLQSKKLDRANKLAH